MRVAKSTILACSLALLLVLAGCNGQGQGGTETDAFPTGGFEPDESTEVEPQTATPATPAPTDVTETERGAALVREARDRGLIIDSVRTDNNTVTVRYFANSTESAVQFGTVLAFAYSEVVNQTWETNATWNASRMDAIAVDADRNPIARYRMMAYWGRQVATGEVSEDQLGNRIDATFAGTRQGQYPPADENLGLFAANVDRTPGMNLTALFQRGETVFVTVENRTDNRSEYDLRVAQLTSLYGAFVNRSFGPETVELEVRDAEGDLEGWYRIDGDRAQHVYFGSRTVLDLVLETYVAEEDRLEG